MNTLSHHSGGSKPLTPALKKTDKQIDQEPGTFNLLILIRETGLFFSSNTNKCRVQFPV